MNGQLWACKLLRQKGARVRNNVRCTNGFVVSVQQNTKSKRMAYTNKIITESGRLEECF